MDTGFPSADSRDDFARARRNATLARLAARLRLRSGDLDVLLPFDEVVAALGRRGETRLGLRTVDLDLIVGSVDRVAASTGSSGRRATRRAGASSASRPPPSWREPAARRPAAGRRRLLRRRRPPPGRRLAPSAWSSIEARVTLIQTRSAPTRSCVCRTCRSRATPGCSRSGCRCRRASPTGSCWTTPTTTPLLAEGWRRGGCAGCRSAASSPTAPPSRWPGSPRSTSRCCRCCARPGCTRRDGELDAQAYLRLSRERYRVLRTHRWDDDVIERLRLPAAHSERRHRTTAARTPGGCGPLVGR